MLQTYTLEGAPVLLGLTQLDPVQGVLAGTSALIGNTVFAFANASAKMLSSARQSLLVAGLDRPAPLPAPPGELCRSVRLPRCHQRW
jgi:hypothetical protein